VRKIFLVLTLAFMFVGIASAFGGESQPVIAVSVGPAIEGIPRSPSISKSFRASLQQRGDHLNV
jgi:hypothetical protein